MRVIVGRKIDMTAPNILETAWWINIDTAETERHWLRCGAKHLAAMAAKEKSFTCSSDLSMFVALLLLLSLPISCPTKFDWADWNFSRLFISEIYRLCVAMFYRCAAVCSPVIRYFICNLYLIYNVITSLLYLFITNYHYPTSNKTKQPQPFRVFRMLIILLRKDMVYTYCTSIKPFQSWNTN